MIVLGVTGGVGMGKSVTSGLLAGRAVPVIDADVVAREVVEPGQPGLEEIRAGFGEGVMRPDGGLNREALARRVFRDEGERRRLEAILHPRIRNVWRAQVARWRSGGERLCAVIVPLLFETGGEVECDRVLCVACSDATQALRLRLRGWGEAEVRGRIGAQWAIERKMGLADHVLWTEPPLPVHARQLDLILGHCGQGVEGS